MDTQDRIVGQSTGVFCCLHTTEKVWHRNGPGLWKRICRRCRTKEDEPFRKARQVSVYGRARTLWNAAKGRSEREGWYFDLDFEFVHEALKLGTCQITGLKFELLCGVGKHPWSPSLDRENPSKGYINKNVRVVCLAYNYAKHTWSDDIVTTLAKALYAVQERTPASADGSGSPLS
jgi:hypothetical protein